MAEFVQQRKEKMLNELPFLRSYFDETTVKQILKQREKFEYRLMRRNKQKSDFTHYITFLKSTLNKIFNMGSKNEQSLKLISQHRNRIVLLYGSALKYFKDDVSLWMEYINFLISSNRITLLQTVINDALLLHGHVSDKLYVFVVKKLFGKVNNIQKAREMYTVGLRAHKNSSALYFEAFKCELAQSDKLKQKLIMEENEFDINDPALNGSIAKVIFESAAENVKNDANLFFKMYQRAILYKFSSNLAEEIKKFMLTTFSTDPNYWDELALNELLPKSKNTEKIKIKNCLERYDDALSIINTDVMWDKYLNTILKLGSDFDSTEVYKRNLIRQSMTNAHMKNKLKPSHYIQWINKSNPSMTNDILKLAAKVYPDDLSILEFKINNLLKTDKHSAYNLFLSNINKVSLDIWLIMVKNFSNEPLIKDIFNLVFGEKSVCANEVKQKIGNNYLNWLIKNKTLLDTRNAYNKLILNSHCDASLCKTIVDIEIKQEKPDITKIRQHFTLACMQFGKTNIDLWMDRIYFELKFGSPKIASSTYHQALTTLNNEQSDKFAEEYAMKISEFNKS